MRPYLETLPWVKGSSLAMLDRRLPDGIPFQWHHHPEFELTLTRNSRGQRFIGDSVAAYGDFDLVLVGPNLPHTWVSDAKLREGDPHWAQVIWFDASWAKGLGEMLVEYRDVADLVGRGQRGLSFSAELGEALAPDFDRFFAASPKDRLMCMLDILCRLQAAPAQLLASAQSQPTEASRARIDRVLAHLHTHYETPVRLEDLAHIAALSVSGLHRLFRRHTGQTVSAYITGLRIGAACAKLSGTDQPIAHVAHEVGYGALANFNRQFKAAQGMTPRQYRARFRA